jgi:hypothetical protein
MRLPRHQYGRKKTTIARGFFLNSGSPTWTRTRDLRINSQVFNPFLLALGPPSPVKHRQEPPELSRCVELVPPTADNEGVSFYTRLVPSKVVAPNPIHGTLPG